MIYEFQLRGSAKHAPFNDQDAKRLVEKLVQRTERVIESSKNTNMKDSSDKSKRS